eukprot:TRINITY_DN13104_c0_g1_i1.p1 TRINITY_DN13104_c0_g1~~TRINITY_DN13104_c0_g1_i1.p1  ORF type:complete len:627 (-),score=109.83 TRINITY_DN13104_c0_g1_i1:21-1901(-)
MYRLNHDIIGKDQGIINKLYELIRDKDPLVVINSLCALEEILASEGGVALNQPIVLHLLNRFNDFNSWGQCLVLKLIAKYQVNEEEELFGLLNSLDTCFQNSNVAVILGTANCFLTFTQTRPEVHKHVYVRMRAPMLSALVGTGPELLFTVLSHILLITKRMPSLFSTDYKQFFVKYKEPLYVRLHKVKVLQAIANDINAKDILTELSAYAVEEPQEFSQESIRAIGRLATMVPSASETALEILLSLLELEQLQHVLSTTLVALKDMIRRFGNIAQDVIPRLAHSLDVVSDSNAITAIITMIGEYGDIISDGPYILEEIVNSWIEKDDKDEKVKNQLLVSTLKLFFKRPKEIKPILGKLFKVATEDTLHPDVHDRALFFYRLLSSNDGENIDRCKEILSNSNKHVEQFVEELDGFEVDRLFEEFDTLSVIYGEGSDRFLKTTTTFDEEEELPNEELRRKADEEEELYKKQDEQLKAQMKDEDSRPLPSSYTAPTVVSQHEPPQHHVTTQLQFNPTALLDPPTFERTWKTFPVLKKIQIPYLARMPMDAQKIDSFFQSQHVKSVAKGLNANVLKMFLYAQEFHSAALFLVELQINQNTKQITANIKSTHDQYVTQFEIVFQTLLQQV